MFFSYSHRCPSYVVFTLRLYIIYSVNTTFFICNNVIHNINLDELKKLLLKYKNILTKLNGDVTDKGSDGWYYVSVGMKERWGPPISPYFF